MASMGSGSAVLDASNEVICGLSTLQDLPTYVLTFSTCLNGAGRILGQNQDISFQWFTMTLVVNVNMNWNYFKDTLTGDKKKLQTLTLVTGVTLSHDEEYFPFLTVETSTAT